jgi:hypothetical protein
MEKHRKLELQEPVPGIISHEFPQKNPFDSMASTFFKADYFINADDLILRRRGHHLIEWRNKRIQKLGGDGHVRDRLRGTARAGQSIPLGIPQSTQPLSNKRARD